MAQVVIIADIREKQKDLLPGWGRAIGPYILASQARLAGFSAVVVDHFTNLENFWTLFEDAVDETTLFVGLASTFLSVEPEGQSDLDRKHAVKKYSDGNLWLSSFEELEKFVLRTKAMIAKKAKRKVIFAIGGTKALHCLQSPALRFIFDCHFIGKAESFFPQFLELVLNGKEVPYAYYEGAPYLHESIFNVTTTVILKNIFQKEDAILKNEALPIEIAKGCMYNCKFCNFEKQGATRRAGDELKADMIRNYELFGTTSYFFMDDCFNDTKAKVYEICNAILSLPFKIDWVSYARVDVAVRFPETLDLMIRSGARGLFWGLETFDHSVGKRVGKGTHPDLVKEMLLRIRKDYGNQCLSMGSFIIGLPGETEESLERTLDWIVETKALHLIYNPVLSIRPYSERLDKAVIHYADFSKNPQKYGFDEVRFEPDYYWRHSTMDSIRAEEIRRHWRDRMLENRTGIGSFITSIFQYPHARSLGYSHEEIVDIILNSQWSDQSFDVFMERQKLQLSDYSQKLQSVILQQRLKS